MAFLGALWDLFVRGFVRLNVLSTFESYAVFIDGLYGLGQYLSLILRVQH